MYYYEDYVNPISYALFSWINWLLKVGYNTPLEMKHLGSLPVKHTTKHNYERLRRTLKKEMVNTYSVNRASKVFYKSVRARDFLYLKEGIEGEDASKVHSEFQRFHRATLASDTCFPQMQCVT